MGVNDLLPAILYESFRFSMFAQRHIRA